MMTRAQAEVRHKEAFHHLLTEVLQFLVCCLENKRVEGIVDCDAWWLLAKTWELLALMRGQVPEEESQEMKSRGHSGQHEWGDYEQGGC